jgi:DNA invertase Pin-like site-specific DNA recombinase
MARAAIYIRRPDGGEGRSLAEQRRACIEYAEANGYTIIETYQDDDESEAST